MSATTFNITDPTTLALEAAQDAAIKEKEVNAILIATVLKNISEAATGQLASGEGSAGQDTASSISNILRS